mgnify:CR=1 FL=1
MVLIVSACPKAFIGRDGGSWRDDDGFGAFASEDFDAFRSLWELSPIEGGTKIRYALLVKPRLRVPSRLVRLGQRRSMRGTLDRLVEQAGLTVD